MIIITTGACAKTLGRVKDAKITIQNIMLHISSDKKLVEILIFNTSIEILISSYKKQKYDSDRSNIFDELE
ncbi:2324_t:CDS:2 [Cetraspora pellucida]|uniref:2324_t:CDS:1 n=1 Tax=Cetraspora pellucida TaxID=1433469 RepID=A0A9N9EZU5_9GLOM|nr:2324_t:CDS:2 [Cetraspora pellucida]